MSRGPGARPVLASVVVHAVIVVPMLVFTRAPEPVMFETIRVNLVAAPAPVEAPPPAPPPPAPEPEPVREEPAPEPVVEEPRPEPPPREPERTERPPEPRPETPPTEPPAAEPTPGADVTVQTEGVHFPFPDYINNVVVQLYRYFRWTEPGNPRATVYFEILPDGSVRDIRVIRPSGNIRFDFAVQGAVETAGNRGAFGPLPDAFAGASLPVELVVEPQR